MTTLEKVYEIFGGQAIHDGKFTEACYPQPHRVGFHYILSASPLLFRARHFKESIEFIHECRLRGESCLVHCLAGVSRSATLVVAYIMTITDFGWEDALSVVRASRSCANPNTGFQRQLEEFEKNDVAHFREWLRAEYGETSSGDDQQAKELLQKYKTHAAAQLNPPERQWNDNFSSVASLSVTAPQ
ncbi:UNVERIFIED_CONTAM: hypothetical protein K2H54_058219 [Gekko kuhli]